MDNPYIFAPLVNFNSVLPEIRVNENFEIRQINSSDRKFLDSISDTMKFKIKGVYAVHSLTVPVGPEANPGEKVGILLPSFQKLITCMRIYRPEIIGTSLIAQRYSLEAHSFHAQYFQAHDLQVHTNNIKLKQPYIVDDRNRTEFSDTISELLALDHNPLELALHYFNKSYIEPWKPRDSLIDLMICLENLLLRNENKELSYKLKTRGAALVGRNVEEKRKLSQLLGEAYATRSKILHGVHLKKNLTHEFVFEVRGFVRQVLHRVLKKPEIINSLDDMVIGDYTNA